MGLRLALALGLVALATAPAAADVEPIEAPAPKPPTPFDRGRFGLGFSGGSQTSLGSHYFVIGGGVGYFVLDGVELGFGALHEFGDGPSISKVSPSLRYIAQPLVGKWPVIPYVGTFYNHWFVGDGLPDEDTVGARAGFIYVSGHLLLGLGIAVEQVVSTCTMDCTSYYPDFTINLAL